MADNPTPYKAHLQDFQKRMQERYGINIPANPPANISVRKRYGGRTDLHNKPRDVKPNGKTD